MRLPRRRRGRGDFEPAQAKPEQAGIPLALADLEIAAIAIANELTLVSGNLRHFSRSCELRVENWLE